MILDKIKKPNDIHKIPLAEFPQLAEEIRSFLIESVSRTGGHLASNLGVVELTMALHKVLHFPEDKLIWDVGHQSYTHKLLTGRKDGFDTLRTLCIDGITANEEVCRRYVHDSIGVVTALNPIIGYKNSTKIAKEALETGRGVYELVLEHGILSKKDLDTILKPENMIKPVKLDIKSNK